MLRPMVMSFSRRKLSIVVWLLVVWAAGWLGAPSGYAAAITATSSRLGGTPSLLAYNAGHFFPGGNTPAWWRYSGVNGARIFISPSTIEPGDDLPPVGDGVASEADFLARRAAIRTNQFNPAYINWTVFTNNYETKDLGGNNHIKVNYACAELRRLGVEICAQMTASQARFPIAGPEDWPNQWELWQSFYAQAFYLASQFEVRRYQMYNEPNHPNAGGLTRANFLLRLQLASDAVQTAIADVNRLYQKSLQPLVLAPVSAGSADSAYPGWGDLVVTNRHLDVLGRFDPSFNLIHIYDYHQYGSTPAGFGTDLADLKALLAQATAPETPPPTSISEFNTRTGGAYDGMVETLDYPAEYARFGAICVNLAANGCDEVYAFKFALTDNNNPNYDVQKNAMHYVDNDRAPYNVGGVNKAGEVWRLFVKGARPGRFRLALGRDSQAALLDTLAAFDATAGRYYLFVANNTAAAVPLALNFQAWGIPATNTVTVEEVSETSYGGVRFRQPAGNGAFFAVQPAQSVWLLSVSARPQTAETTLPPDADGEARDGAFVASNFGEDPAMTVQNDSENASNRRVALIRFTVPVANLDRLESAVLEFAAAATTNAVVQAHVYAVDAGEWSETALNWLNAPNLRQNVPAGARIAQNVVAGVGSTAHIAGQLVANQTAFATRQLEVTPLVRAATNGTLTFMVSQDPRWDVALPSLEAGDRQPGGLILRARESGTEGGPKLRLVYAATVPPPVGVPVWTNATLAGEAVIRGGSEAGKDQNEAVAGYLMVKAGDSPFEYCRKAYFHFQMPPEDFETTTQALFTAGFQAKYKQAVQLWALNQSYPDFSPAITWNNAQANDTAGGGLKTEGAFTASPIGGPVLVPVTGTEPYTFIIPRLGDYAQGTNLWLVLTAVPDAANDAGGLRLLRTNAVLQILTYIPRTPRFLAWEFNPASGMSMAGVGIPNQSCRLEFRADLLTGSWTPVLTNFCDAEGRFSFTNAPGANGTKTFYRAVQP